jgi:hypothetical protein
VVRHPEPRSTKAICVSSDKTHTPTRIESTGIPTGTKAIDLDDEAYDRLEAQKREGEGFSDTVKRITEEVAADWRHSIGTHDGDRAAAFADAVERSHETTNHGLAARRRNVDTMLADEREAEDRGNDDSGADGWELLDTTFLVHPLTRESLVAPYLEARDDPGPEFLVSTIATGELAVGSHHLDDDPTVADLRADLGWVTILPFTTRHAFYAGSIENHLNGYWEPRRTTATRRSRSARTVP